MPLTMPLYTRADIEALIPHRAPILIPHQVDEFEPGQTLTSSRTFLPNDALFEGHFPGNPILPGVLLVEGMAQSAALLVSLTRQLNANNALYLFMGVEETRFKQPVLPNQMVSFKVTQLSEKLGIFKFSGQAVVNGNQVARSTFTAKLVLKS